MVDLDTIQCIYCKQFYPRPSKGEHILLDGLGGHQAIRDVCSDCNQLFANSIDRETLRNSLVAMNRFFYSRGKSGEQQAFYHLADHDVLLDAMLLNKTNTSVILPQLYLHDGIPVAISSVDYEKERLELLKQPIEVFERAPHYIYDWNFTGPTRVVFQPKRRRYIVRGRTKEDIGSFLGLLRSKKSKLEELASGKSRELLTPPKLHKFTLTHCTAPNDAPRCAAKMAFNFLSYYLGPDVALRSEFDGVRRYITGEDVEPVQDVPMEDGELGWTVDVRYVQSIIDTNQDASEWLLLREAHYIQLWAMNRMIGAEVALYGGRNRFVVILGEAGPDLEVTKDLPAILFKPINGGDERVLAGAQLIEELQQAGRYLPRPPTSPQPHPAQLQP